MSNLIRVEFEYSDGTLKQITGKELEKWMGFNAIANEQASLHGMNLPWNEVNWSFLSKDRTHSTKTIMIDMSDSMDCAKDNIKLVNHKK